MTGDCGEKEHVGYTVYRQIASTSSGQLFELNKEQVKQVRRHEKQTVIVACISCITYLQRKFFDSLIYSLYEYNTIQYKYEYYYSGINYKQLTFRY